MAATPDIWGIPDVIWDKLGGLFHATLHIHFNTISSFLTLHPHPSKLGKYSDATFVFCRKLNIGCGFFEVKVGPTNESSALTDGEAGFGKAFVHKSLPDQ